MAYITKSNWTAKWHVSGHVSGHDILPCNWTPFCLLCNFPDTAQLAKSGYSSEVATYVANADYTWSKLHNTYNFNAYF